MTDNQPERLPPASAADIDAYTIGGARRHEGTIHLAEYDPLWPALFAREARRIRDVLRERAITIEHVGSTSVPGLAAKPVIDIVLEVADSGNESSYVPPLESFGYVLRIREPDWFKHRMLKGPDTDVNLHVFSAGCPEVGRMLALRNHLRGSSADRNLYEQTKRKLAAREWDYIQNYADAKTDVIREIMAQRMKAER